MRDSGPLVDPATDPLCDPREYFNVVVGQIRDCAIFTVDVHGHARSWNEGVRRILGFEEADFVGADVTSTIFTPEAIIEGVPAREIEQAARTGQANDDRWMRRKDGSPFYATGTTTALRRGDKIIGYVKVMRDITQWKDTQSELQRTVNELARVDRMRSEFIAVLAHELRNPMAPLGNAVQILRKSMADAPGAESTLAMMERQIGQMNRLISDLLDVSRIAHDKIELQRDKVELTALVQQSLEVARPQAEALQHNVTLAQPPQALFVDADATRLVQVFVNLLNNAYKFTAPNGQIWVSTEFANGEAAVRIRDSGVGIPIAEQARIFDMFSQVDSSRERSRGGLGIGLSLVRKLVELHGGTVAVNSGGHGTGSEFIVRLPLVPAPATSTQDRTDEVIAEAANHVKRILVVDDNEDAAMTLAALLELEGHHASIAHSGETAIRMAMTERPELIVLDIGMPGMSGLKVAEYLRQQDLQPEPVLVALTGWGQAEDRRLTQAAGFDHHLVKPVDVDSLRQIVATLD